MKHLTPEQLIAFRDRESEDPEAHEHLASCPVCQRALDDSRWGMTLRSTRGAAGTDEHPAGDELAAYLHNALSPRRNAQVQRHLRRCDRCAAVQHRLRTRERLASYSSPAPGLIRRAQRRLARRAIARLGALVLVGSGKSLRLTFVPAGGHPPAAMGLGRLGGSTKDRSAGVAADRGRHDSVHPASARRRRKRIQRRSAVDESRAPDTGAGWTEQLVFEDSAASEGDMKRLDAASKETAHGPAKDEPVAGSIDLPGQVTVDSGDIRLRFAAVGHQSGPELAVVVHTRDRGRPVAGLRLKLLLGDRLQEGPAAETDERGRVVLPLPPEATRVRIDSTPPCELLVDTNPASSPRHA